MDISTVHKSYLNMIFEQTKGLNNLKILITSFWNIGSFNICQPFKKKHVDKSVKKKIKQEIN